MNTHADKTHENKGQSMASEPRIKQSSSESLFQFVDNRPEAVEQRKLQEMANNSPQAKQAAQLHAMVSGPSTQKNQTIQKRENNTGLPDNLKTGIENMSGYSMDDVKVHRNSDKPAKLHALAYAQGTDIHLGPSQEKHLPHEAWHVVQQKQGRVKPTLQMKSGVTVNDDFSLESEADTMGAKAFRLSIPTPSSTAIYQKFSPSTCITVQAVWKDADTSGEVYWTPMMDGVTWFADESGLMWFQVTAEESITRGRMEEYKGLEGKENKRSWVEWNKISVEPSPEFTADITHDSSLEELGADNGDENWAQWDKYINIAIGTAAPQDKLANVHKDPAFDPSTHERLKETDELGFMKDYISKFKVVSKQEYNFKLWEMAEKIASLGRYTCIVSEPGKSNFWITARVLKKVKILGGNAPVRIISVPTQEKGILDRARAGDLDIDLSDAGDIVFLDDGSFSGSQLFKLIQKVIKTAQNKVRLGLVALSRIAGDKIERPQEDYLTNPIPIESYEHAEMEQVHKKLRIPGKSDVDSPDHGDHLLGFYYKVPDFASVRTTLLTDTKDKTDKTALTGYSAGKLDFSSGYPPKTVGATEPYKVTKGASPTEFGLEEVAYKSSSKLSRGFDVRRGMGLGQGRGIKSTYSGYSHKPVQKPKVSFASTKPLTDSRASVKKTTDPNEILESSAATRVWTEAPKNQELLGRDGNTYLYVDKTLETGEFHFIRKDE